MSYQSTPEIMNPPQLCSWNQRDKHSLTKFLMKKQNLVIFFESSSISDVGMIFSVLGSQEQTSSLLLQAYYKLEEKCVISSVMDKWA